METKKIVSAGNQGKDVRSDCFVTLELKDTGGLVIDLQSKVQTLYGEQLRKVCYDVLSFFEIQNAVLTVVDAGSLDFVLAARIEACIKQLIETPKEYLPELIEENCYKTGKERFRFSRLYLPGNTPKLAINAGIHTPNGIILDLEDSVAPDKKFEAAILVRNVLRQINFYGSERMVRINQLPKGLDDLKYIVPHNVNLILIPKCENPQQIIEVENEINKIGTYNDHPVFFMPIIESALGVEKAFEIATASPNVVALAIGLEDLTADLGVKRTHEAHESLYARTRLINACKAAKIQPIDSVFSDIGDMEALKATIQISKGLGFEGMGCIHPRQIQVIHEGYAPDSDEIEKAKKIMKAFDEAKEKGLGVVALGSKMIDPPVVKRAEKTIGLAISLGLLPENWKEQGLNT